MNSCKHCGKEIPEGRKFCNKSCAAHYNNRFRVRKPWTEEKRLEISKQRRQAADAKRIAEGKAPVYSEDTRTVINRFCKHCGKPLQIKDGEWIVCNECRPYSKANLYKKLGLNEGPLKRRFEEAVRLVRRWYFENKESICQISEKTGLQYGAVRYLLTVNGGVTRDHSESSKVSLETGRRKETPCSFKFKQGTHTSWEGNKFHFRSSWEEQYMQELDEKRVPYLYEAFRIRYFDTQKNEERIAVPDFFLPETNTIVELKSSYTYDERNMKDRFKSYQEKGYKTILLLDWEEIDL